MLVSRAIISAAIMGKPHGRGDVKVQQAALPWFAADQHAVTILRARWLGAFHLADLDGIANQF
jgi:hypothetical protein